MGPESSLMATATMVVHHAPVGILMASLVAVLVAVTVMMVAMILTVAVVAPSAMLVAIALVNFAAAFGWFHAKSVEIVGSQWYCS